LFPKYGVPMGSVIEGQVKAGILDVGYLDSGPADGFPAILLHGFPYDPRSFDGVSDILVAAGLRCIRPYMRGYGPTRFCSPDTPRSGQQGAFGTDLRDFMDALGITTAVLGGFDWGGRSACIVSALWPQRVRGLVSCGSGYNILNIARGTVPAPPKVEHRYWYQYYFHTARGRAGLTSNRREFCRLLWHLWSPTWTFDDPLYERVAGSFDNPDFVDVVLHSYCHRYGSVPSDPAYDELEAVLAAEPAITVPAIILQGADDGVDSVIAEDIAAPHFTGPYQRRILPGVGHGLPQEAPAAFAAAVLELTQ
jgi:pimeloyl-ACP methyl ester carboxylesterase